MPSTTATTAAHFVYVIETAQALGDITRPIASARYYVGEAKDVAERLGEHQRGVGARLLAYAARQGITFDVILVIGCDSKATATMLEKLIKNGGGVARQLPSLRKLAEQVVTAEVLARRGRKNPKAVVQKRQERLNRRAEQRRQAVEDAAFDASLGGRAEIVRGGARPILATEDYPAMPAYVYQDLPGELAELAF